MKTQETIFSQNNVRVVVIEHSKAQTVTNRQIVVFKGLRKIKQTRLNSPSRFALERELSTALSLAQTISKQKKWLAFF